MLYRNYLSRITLLGKELKTDSINSQDFFYFSKKLINLYIYNLSLLYLYLFFYLIFNK